MTYGKSTETFVGKVIGSRDHFRHRNLPHQARRLLYSVRLAGARHTCYSCNWRRDSLPDLEEEARLQLVKQEDIHV